jgi:SPP1 family predicted phage head-tail adaptor
MILNPLDIGRLDKRVTFLAPGAGKDELSQTTQEYGELLPPVWATVKALRGGEYFEAQKIRPEKAYKITVRYTKDVNDDAITPDMRIAYRDKILEIEYVNNVEEANYMLEILATEYIEKTAPDAEEPETAGGDPYG